MNQKLKLLHILWTGEIGGTEEYIISLVKVLDHSKYDINLCFLSRKGLIFEEALKLDNVNVAFIGIKNGYDLPGAIKFAYYLSNLKFDIIHSHMRNFLSTAVMAFFTPGVHKILTHHIGPVDVRLFKKERRFYKLFSRVFQKITAISGAVKDNLINDLDVKPADKVKIIHNGIDLEKFNRSDAVPSDLRDVRKSGRFIMGYVGRMEYFKRPRLFIKIASRLIKKDINYYFVMVGDGPEFEECEKLITFYDIGKHFRLLGFRRDVPEILGLFDAMLFTGEGEGFGIVIIEAMSKGIPVFAINDGAVPEIINHEENGILLDTADPEVIAEHILKVIKDNKLIDKIRKQCSEDVHSRFSINECAQKMEKVYQSVL